MAGLLRLARPVNCVMSAVGVAIGGVVGVGSRAWGDLAQPLVLAAAAAAAFTAGGNALNDIFDRETDRINHPDRPLASGHLTLGTARAFAGNFHRYYAACKNRFQTWRVTHLAKISARDHGRWRRDL